jgi:hypothetical protein
MFGIRGISGHREVSPEMEYIIANAFFILKANPPHCSLYASVELNNR